MTLAELPEMTPEEALAEDYARLRLSFRESVAHEQQRGQGLDVSVSDASRNADREQRRAQISRAEQDLAAVLASPTWRLGRIITAVPRRLRRSGS
jgi:hypothetical protein